MSKKWISLTCTLLALAAGCAAEPAAEDAESSADELRFCRSDAPRLPDRTAGKSPLAGAADVQVAASLPYPPGNVAVAADGRVFLSMFPDTNYGDVKVGVLGAGGALLPFPSAAFQRELHSVLGIRMDRLGRLWVLDHGKMGLHRPRLFAFDVATGAKAVEVKFDTRVAPFGSMLNDLQIAPDGKTAYVSDASLLAGKPAIVVVDLGGPAPKARRVLEKHPALVPGRYDVVVGGKKAKIAGLFCAEGGVDGIALDATGEHLYVAPLNAGALHRIPTSALRDASASAATVAAAVEKWADTTMTDGMIADGVGNVYLTDMEHSAVVRVRPDRTTEVVAKDARFRWPDGMSWSPSGDLYLTASALHETLRDLVRTPDDIEDGAPYHVFRIRVAGAKGVVGQ